jgi:hypothetical protein
MTSLASCYSTIAMHVGGINGWVHEWVMFCAMAPLEEA